MIGRCRASLPLSRARAVSRSQELEDDLEWKLIYVGSADDEEMDQTLEEVMVGPVPVGVNKFVFHSALAYVDGRGKSATQCAELLIAQKSKLPMVNDVIDNQGEAGNGTLDIKDLLTDNSCL